MGKQPKPGLDYFSLDVDIFRDPKLLPLKRQYGPGGMAVYINLLCQIYRDKGYYLEDYDLLPFVISDETKVGENLVRQILNFLPERSLFDNTLFQSDKVYTSRSIQRRYQAAKTASGKKNPIAVNKKYWLLDENETKAYISYAIFQNEGENEGFLGEESTKESKEKKRKGEEARALPFPPDSFEYKASEYLRDSVLKVLPKQRVPKTEEELQKWAESVAQMKRIDKMSEDDIRALIRFAMTDLFWRTNIRSTKKLREKREELYAQMVGKRLKKSAEPAVNTENAKEKTNAEIERRKKEMGL